MTLATSDPVTGAATAPVDPATRSVPRAGGRPLRADAERNRRRILDAARTVFASAGVEASLDDVARAAGVGVGTVYRRFATREALVEALFVERLEGLVSLAQAGLADPDPWHGFTTFFDSAAEAIAADAGLRDVVLCSSYGDTEVARAREGLLPAVTALVTRAQEAGALRRDLQPQEMPLLLSMVGGLARRTSSAAPGLWRRYAALLLDGLREEPAGRGLRRRAVERPMPPVAAPHDDLVARIMREPC